MLQLVKSSVSPDKPGLSNKDLTREDDDKRMNILLDIKRMSIVAVQAPVEWGTRNWAISR